MLSQVVASMMSKNKFSKRGKSNFRRGRTNNENDKNNGRCYECGKYGHIQADCPILKTKLSRNFQKKKSFGSWSDEEESDLEEIANMCFMAIKEDSNEDTGELSLMADEGTSEVRLPTYPNYCELQEFVNISLEDIERVLNELRKIQREKKDSALKVEVCEIEHDMLQEEEHRKKNRKGKWYLDSACSRHMIGDKQLFKTVTKLDGGTVTFGDKSKGNVIGVGKVPLSSTCDVDVVYLVDELGYNLISISQLCDNDYEVLFKKHDWFIEEKSGKVILSESIHVIFVDTNPHSRNEKLPEDEEISIVPKSVVTGKDCQEESTGHQDQSTEEHNEVQEFYSTEHSTIEERETTTTIPNEWKSEPGYPHKFLIGNPHEGITTIRKWMTH
ncbi:uncharacterized protein [Nicotiana tomentosiformis]|uniref:uncharacterized protein n=1 Tax=Nicotiana tomentosiformis TaxID=4098 RepID=UPI00388C55BE